MDNINSSNLSDLLSFLNNQHQKQLSTFPSGTFQTNSISKISPKNYKKDNLLNINSSLNIPSPKNNINLSLNEQDNDNEENDPIFKEYSIINEKRNLTIDELKDINEKIKDNNSEIEDIKIQLKNLKLEKKQKQVDIVNLLSNKESIEEIYKNRIYLLINHNNKISDNNIYNNKIIDNSLKKEIDSINTSIINSNSNRNTSIADNNAISNDNFKIIVDDIKESDKNKFIKQVINMVDDIFKKKEKKLNSLIVNIIDNSYEVFFNNINDVNEKNNEIIITNFFTKISLFISNNSLGEFPEQNINILLRYLLLINTINKKLNKYIKFVNKKYKEKKKELNNMLNNLEKNKKELNQKKYKLEKIMKEFDEKFEIFEKNNDFLIEKKIENSIEDDNTYNRLETLEDKKNEIFMNKEDNLTNKKEIEYNKEIIKEIEIEKEQLIKLDKRYENNIGNNNIYILSKINNNNNDKELNTSKKLKNNINENLKIIEDENENEKENTNLNNLNNIIINKNIGNDEENKNELSHEVIIEYEDGIDQNVEINYEEDDMSNEYNFEKENELINQGINPYNNNEIRNINIINNDNNNIKNDSNRQIYKDETKLLNDIDENDKYLNTFLNNNNNNDINKNNNYIIYLKKNDSNNNVNNITEESSIKLNNKNVNIDYYIMEGDNNKDILDLIDNNNNNKFEKNKKIKNIENNSDNYNNNNNNSNNNNSNNSKRNNNTNNHKIIEIKEKRNRDNNLNSNIRKINDYTFNISINNSNKNIFTENIPKNNSNSIQNLKTKNINNNNNNNNNTQSIKSKVKNEFEDFDLIEKKIKTKNSKSISLTKNNEKFQLAKKIKYNEHHYIDNDNINNKEEIITYKISSITKNELQGISINNNKNNEKNLDEIIKSIEISNYKRVQRIMNGNDNNSNYNYSNNNNSENNNIKDNSLLISPIKKDPNNSSMNKFDKKIHIKGGKNHNYISIINITNNAPVEKKEEKENNDNKDNNNYDDHKIYIKKLKGNFNKKKIKENNNLNEKDNKKDNNECDIDDKFEITDNENTSKNNDIDLLKKNSNDIIEPIKVSKNIKKIDLSQYLNNNKNIINEKTIKNKQIDNNINNKKINKNTNNDNNNNKDNGKKNLNNNNIERTPTKKTNNNNLSNKKTNNSKLFPYDFFNNINASTLKITKSREIDINEIKNTKLSMINKRNFSKTISNKNQEKEKEKEKCKLIYNINKNKNALSLNKNKSNTKKIKNKNSVSSFSFKSGNNNKNPGLIKKEIIIKDISKINDNKTKYINYNTTKRANSLNIEKSLNNNLELRTYRRKNNKIGKNVVNITSSNNNKNNNNININNKTNLKNIVSPNNIKKLKIINIPVSKMRKNKNDYNSNTYDGNFNRNRSNIKEKNNNKIFLDYSELNEDENKYFTNSSLNTINVNKSSFLANIYNNLEYFDNSLNILTKGTKQVLCYYRIYKRNNIELNILEKSSQNLEIFGFSQGYIFLSLKLDILKFIPKVNSNNELCIKLKNINGLQIEQYMLNVIKYNSINNELRNKENTELIMQNEKNKSPLYKIFSFNILVNDLYEGKIECILNKFEIYFLLIKYFEKIVEYNKNNDICDNNVYNNYNLKSI